MKLHEVYQTPVQEGPVDKILSKFGSKTAQGREETNQIAKKYSDTVTTAMARSGKETISAKQLTNFLLKNKMVSQAAIDTVYAKVDMDSESEVVQDTAEKLPNQALQNLKNIAKQELKKRKKTPKLKRPAIDDQTKSKVIKSLGMLAAAGLVAGSLYTAHDVSSKYDDLSSKYQQTQQTVQQQVQDLQDQKEKITSISQSKEEAEARLKALAAEQAEIKAQAEADKLEAQKALAKAESDREALEKQISIANTKIEKAQKAQAQAEKEAKKEAEVAKQNTTKKSKEQDITPWSEEHFQYMLPQIKDGVTKNFKDPASAIFDKISLRQTSDGEYIVTGYVNAKNSYGAYTGNKPFASSLLKVGDTLDIIVVAPITGENLEPRYGSEIRGSKFIAGEKTLQDFERERNYVDSGTALPGGFTVGMTLEEIQEMYPEAKFKEEFKKFKGISKGQVKLEVDGAPGDKGKTSTLIRSQGAKTYFDFDTDNKLVGVHYHYITAMNKGSPFRPLVKGEGLFGRKLSNLEFYFNEMFKYIPSELKPSSYGEGKIHRNGEFGLGINISKLANVGGDIGAVGIGIPMDKTGTAQVSTSTSDGKITMGVRTQTGMANTFHVTDVLISVFK